MSSYDYRTGLSRESGTSPPSHWFSKLLALIILLLCVAIGMMGLILPVIPGFLFLMLAAVIAARLHPPLEAYLRRYAWCRSYLDKAGRFAGLDLRGKAQTLCWFVLKVVVDSFLLAIAALAWLLRFAFGEPQKAGS